MGKMMKQFFTSVFGVTKTVAVVLLSAIVFGLMMDYLPNTLLDIIKVKFLS